MYFNNNEWNISIFGTINPNGIVKNVGFIDCYINATRFVAGICTTNYGCIENCYITGVINGVDEVAGICHQNYKNIKNCYVAGNVNAEISPAAIVASNKESGNVTNCYYLDTTTSNAICYNKGTATKVESKTLAKFKSGEVAYILQGDMAKHVWGQAIGTDDYPVIGGPKVNYGYTCTDTELGYKNEICFETPGHKYDNGFCPRCHGYQPAEKVSTTHHPELNATHNGYYAIENGGQLYWLAGVVNGTIDGTSQDVAANAVLANNITVNKNVLKADGSLSDDAGSFRVWNPIGYYKDESDKSSVPTQYCGHFDGNGKTVSGLYYNMRVPNAYFIGLFGVVGKNATDDMVGNVTNVGVVDSYFNGREEIAGICGACIGANISNCYSSATVVGTALHSGAPAYNIAGICGGLIENGTITNCYNTGQVSGTESLGGICGIAMGTIVNCYNTGNIQGEKDNNGGICGLISASTVKNCYNTGQVSGSANTGGVLGGATDEEGSNTISNCYYDNGTCTAGGIDGADVAGKAEGKSTAQFDSGEVAYLLSKGYNGSVWGQKLGTDAYPILGGAKVYYGYALDDCQHISYSNTTLTETPNHTYDNGFCTICDGYQPAIKVDGNYAIENAGQLYWFADQVNNYYQTNYTDGAVLVADITVNKGVLNSDGSLSANSSSFRSWPGIGYWTETQSRVLYGTFDGNGHIISGLYTNDANKDYTGLIGYGQCTIKNIGIVDAYFKGKDYVGSICGYNNWGNILNCYSVSSVAGTSNVGSICGYNYNGTIANNYYDNKKCSIGGVNDTDVSGQTVGKTEDKFHNGEVAYLLAHGDENVTWDYEIWGQQLGVDDYPVGSDYKLVPAAQKTEDCTYWATFSDQGDDITLSVPSGRTLKVYNATVSSGKLTLSERNDCQVAVEEGVLLKTDGEYVNMKANEDYTLTPVAYTYNNLVATPSYPDIIESDAGYTLYRLTYNKVATKEGLGFYLGSADGVSDGSQLKATPGKAYLKVANSEVKTSPSGAAVRGFVFPDNDEDITGIECITVSDDELRGNGNNSVHDLGGRKVSDSSKGVVIKRGRKEIRN